MNIRQFDAAKDYEDVCKWWTSQDWPALPLSMLSDTGFIAENDKGKIAATWLIKNNCSIYLVEWTVGNPDCDWETRAEGLHLVNEKACEAAKEDGASFVLTMTKNKRLIEKLKESNFGLSDENMTHLMRRL